MAQLYITEPRKNGWFEPSEGWVQTHHERGDYIECSVYEKHDSLLTNEDKELVESYGEVPDEWLAPYRIAHYDIDVGATPVEPNEDDLLTKPMYHSVLNIEPLLTTLGCEPMSGGSYAYKSVILKPLPASNCIELSDINGDITHFKFGTIYPIDEYTIFDILTYLNLKIQELAEIESNLNASYLEYVKNHPNLFKTTDNPNHFIVNIYVGVNDPQKCKRTTVQFNFTSVEAFHVTFLREDHSGNMFAYDYESDPKTSIMNILYDDYSFITPEIDAVYD